VAQIGDLPYRRLGTGGTPAPSDRVPGFHGDLADRTLSRGQSERLIARCAPAQRELTSLSLMNALIHELKSKIIAALHLEKVTPDDIADEAPLFGTGLGLDSIDALELVALLEQDYGIVIQERAVADTAFVSVRALADFVANQRGSCSDGPRS
jgi:acyl carrier protein